MGEKNFELVVIEGPLKGQKFQVGEGGLRFGRSASCDIASTEDLALSRNHCLFELVDGEYLVTDLASANGTLLNEEPLGAESIKLNAGDIIRAGDTAIKVVDTSRKLSFAETLDLGFIKESVKARKEAEEAKVGSSPLIRVAIWGVAIAIVAGAIWFILGSDIAISQSSDQDESSKMAELPKSTKLHSVYYEKVEASSTGIYRYALSMNGEGEVFVEIDDVPKENRHVRKNAKLSESAKEAISRMMVPGYKDQTAEESRLVYDLYRLEKEYTGVPSEAGSHNSLCLRVVAGARVFSVKCENMLPPEALEQISKRLETFSKNELGMWAIQYSSEKLVQLSKECRNAGDAKWEERAVKYGNLASALSSYNEAVFYLDTVNPKPQDYGELIKRRDEVAAELDRRYRDQRFMADRAINLKDWTTARRELQILCELVPDKKDPRHSEASSKLLDVEARIKKGE